MRGDMIRFRANGRTAPGKLSETAAEVHAHFYDADHAFFNDTRPEMHDPGAAEEAWTRSVSFLKKHLH